MKALTEKQEKMLASLPVKCLTEVDTPYLRVDFVDTGLWVFTSVFADELATESEEGFAHPGRLCYWILDANMKWPDFVEDARKRGYEVSIVNGLNDDSQLGEFVGTHKPLLEEQAKRSYLDHQIMETLNSGLVKPEVLAITTWGWMFTDSKRGFDQGTLHKRIKLPPNVTWRQLLDIAKNVGYQLEFNMDVYGPKLDGKWTRVQSSKKSQRKTSSRKSKGAGQ